MRHLPEHTNSSIAKSSQYLSDLMEDVLLRAKKQGATDASVAANHDEGFSVNVRMGEVETVAFSEEKGIGITVYIGQQKGSASSSDRSEAALDAMVAAAMDIARVSAPDPCFGLPDKALMQNTYPALDLCHPWSITPEHAITMAKTCEAEALRLDQRITNSDGVSVSSYNFCSGYASSQGFLGVVPGSRHSVSCSLIAKENDIMQRDYDYTNSRKAEELLSLDALAASVVERTTSRLGARQLKTQKCPVLFSSRVSSGLFSSLIQAISGSNLYKKNSFLLNSMGEMLFPSFIQVYEQPHLLGALGSSPFDAEGVVTRDNTFIKDGILCQYVLGSYSARKMGLTTTANAGGVHNLTVNPTVDGLPALMKTMGTGLLVTELMGQGFNLLTGDYSRGATGFWVQDGVIQHPVEEITIAGHMKDIFRNVVAVGADINPNVSTRCGSVLIEEMMLAGH